MYTILLVDDEPELLELYSEVLELMDHRVLQAHDGREALDLAHERRPDLVVTDVQMPRMNGVELCQRLVQDEELHDIPVIMHSAASSDPHAPGVRVFLSKFCELEEFEAVVHQALSGAEDLEPVHPRGPRAPPSHPTRECVWETTWDTTSSYECNPGA